VLVVRFQIVLYTNSTVYDALPANIQPSDTLYYPCVHGTELDTGTITISTLGVITFNSQTNSYETDDYVYLGEQVYSTD